MLIVEMVAVDHTNQLYFRVKLVTLLKMNVKSVLLEQKGRLVKTNAWLVILDGCPLKELLLAPNAWRLVFSISVIVIAIFIHLPEFTSRN